MAHLPKPQEPQDRRAGGIRPADLPLASTRSGSAPAGPPRLPFLDQDVWTGSVPPFSCLCGDIRGGLGQPNGASRSWSAMPDSPIAMRSANGSSAASTRRSAPFRDGFADWGATPAGGGDGRVKTRTAPRPNRAPVPLGSLPTTPQAAPAPRPTVRRSRKTLPRQRMNRPGGAHHRSAKMCIDLHCLLHTSGTAPDIRTPPDSSPRQPIRNPCFDKGDGALQSGL